MAFTVINAPPAIGDSQFASEMQAIVGQFRTFSQELNAIAGVLVKAPTLITASNAAWTPDSKTSMILFEVQGGGGGGAGAFVPAGQIAVGGCGSAGGYVLGWDEALASYNITIGGWGAGGTGNFDGADGGDTTVTASGLTLTAGGGTGGVYRISNAGSTLTTDRGAGGSASGGIVNVTGERGSAGGTSQLISRGNGGNTRFGRGGMQVGLSGSAGSGNGAVATGYGAGGGGAGGNNQDNVSYTGGNGSPGCVLIWEYA